jgi:phosphoribosyl-ATP pyrophosphohydrolase
MVCAIAQSLTVRTFRAGTDKEVARKVPEEAAEAYSAWETLSHSAVLDGIGFSTYIERHKADLADELADCITACCNLAARYGLDLQEAIDRVEARNRERGRYGRKD